MRWLLLLALGCRDPKCENAGGHWESYDCTTIIIQQSCGDNCWMPVPITNCHYRCKGAKPELPPQDAR